MKNKARIYKPAKTAMQSGKRNTKNWILEFDTYGNSISPLMGWNTSIDTMSEVKLQFSTKVQAINFAKKIILTFMLLNLKKQKL